MSEHSRGPWAWKWTFYPGADRDVPAWIVKDADGMPIANQPIFSNPIPAEANARLIAAAPELLDALKAAQNYIANTESELGITLSCGERARAAIAKAEGN